MTGAESLGRGTVVPDAWPGSGEDLLQVGGRGATLTRERIEKHEGAASAGRGGSPSSQAVIRSPGSGQSAWNVAGPSRTLWMTSDDHSPQDVCLRVEPADAELASHDRGEVLALGVVAAGSGLEVPEARAVSRCSSAGGAIVQAITSAFPANW